MRPLLRASATSTLLLHGRRSMIPRQRLMPDTTSAYRRSASRSSSRWLKYIDSWCRSTCVSRCVPLAWSCDDSRLLQEMRFSTDKAMGVTIETGQWSPVRTTREVVASATLSDDGSLRPTVMSAA